MVQSSGIRWTHRSVLKLAKGEDPIIMIERMARDLVLRARDSGWNGPPFNPVAIAELLKIPIEANADVVDARTVSKNGGVKIQFNPAQARERVRFSIAHEIAHSLFPDVADETRHRGGNKQVVDDWQLEMLCNLAAAEFVMPIGSMTARDEVPRIEQLMTERKKFDVSSEAFLIRTAKTSNEPITMFCASPVSDESGLKAYRIDYTVSSKSSPAPKLVGQTIPKNSTVYSCTAIGYSNTALENWPLGKRHTVECVGIPGYPGSRYPRVAGLVRFEKKEARPEAIKFVHRDVLDPLATGPRIVCQVVNDQARFWGGGVAKAAAAKFPKAHKDFSTWITSISRPKRLGEVHFVEAEHSLFVASLVAQHGFGPSLFPRLRYAALERCLERVASLAATKSASVHMPRIGTGASGGSWEMVEELIRSTLVAREIPVTIYDLPPRRSPNPPGLFD